MNNVTPSKSWFPPVVLLSSALVLAGCEQLDQFNKEGLGTGIGAIAGGLLGSQVGSGKGQIVAIIAGAAAGAWIGNRFGAYLDEQDRQKATAAVQLAAVTGELVTWENDDTGVSGSAEVVATETAEASISVPILKDRIESVPPLTMIAATYEATADADVRGGPSTEHVIVDNIKEGQVVFVAGQVQNESWYLISQNGVATGFVETDPLTPAPSGTPETNSQVASADLIDEAKVQSTRTCRTILQSITLKDGTTQEEEITACQGPSGWVVV